jgi:hypothetical protein
LIEKRARIFAKRLEKGEQGASLAPNKTSAAPNKPGAAPKKEQGASPAPKIVSTLFSRKFGFDLD